MIAVVEAAHVRPRDDRARGRWLNGPTHRREKLCRETSEMTR